MKLNEIIKQPEIVQETKMGILEEKPIAAPAVDSIPLKSADIENVQDTKPALELTMGEKTKVISILRQRLERNMTVSQFELYATEPSVSGDTRVDITKYDISFCCGICLTIVV